MTCVVQRARIVVVGERIAKQLTHILLPYAAGFWLDNSFDECEQRIIAPLVAPQSEIRGVLRLFHQFVQVRGGKWRAVAIPLADFGQFFW